MRFASKTAVVTGAASGLGLEISRRLAAEGANVILADIDREKGEAAAASVSGNARFHFLDVGSEESWARLEASLDTLDLLVNNAGIALNGTIEDVAIDAWRRAFRVNADGPMLGCKMAVRMMKGREGGAIVNIASAAAVKPTAFAFAYSASKAAVIMLSKGVALYCAQQKTGIRCNVVNPGVIDTPIHEQVYAQFGSKEAAWEMYEKLTPLGIVGQPHDVAEAVLYLGSPAARFITGAVLEVDGGLAIC
jgi:NAD(P)-dependent dehydrogenase (short-subunit alcohol dehydrogenase family)